MPPGELLHLNSPKFQANFKLICNLPMLYLNEQRLLKQHNRQWNSARGYSSIFNTALNIYCQLGNKFLWHR